MIMPSWVWRTKYLLTVRRSTMVHRLWWRWSLVLHVIFTLILYFHMRLFFQRLFLGGGGRSWRSVLLPLIKWISSEKGKLYWRYYHKLNIVCVSQTFLAVPRRKLCGIRRSWETLDLRPKSYIQAAVGGAESAVVVKWPKGSASLDAMNSWKKALLRCRLLFIHCRMILPGGKTTFLISCLRPSL